MQQKMYCRIRYDKDNDMFILETRTARGTYDDGNYVMGAKCMKIEGDNAPNHIHFSIIKQLQELVRLGYTFEAV